VTDDSCDTIGFNKKLICFSYVSLFDPLANLRARDETLTDGPGFDDLEFDIDSIAQRPQRIDTTGSVLTKSKVRAFDHSFHLKLTDEDSIEEFFG
jgi:hypothetical protein